MYWFLTLLTFAHIIGMALGIGAATVKLWLGLKCKSDPTYIQPFLKTAPFMSHLIVIGMILAPATRYPIV